MLDSSAIKSAAKLRLSMLDSSALKAVAELQSSMLGSSALTSAAELRLSMLDSSAIKSAAKLQSSILDSSALTSVAELRSSMLGSSALKAVAELQSSILGSSALTSAAELRLSMLDSSAIKSATKLQSSILDIATSTVKSMEGLQSSIIDAVTLTSIDGLPADDMFNASTIDAMQLAMPSINSATLAALKSFQIDIGEHNLSNDENIDVDEKDKLENNLLSEVVETLNTSKEFQLLSDSSKTFLLYVYHKYILQVLLSLVASIIVVLNQDEILEIQEKFQAAESPAQVKKLMKSQPIISNSELLKGYRVTTDRLNLRAEPKMKSDVIVTLPIHTLINVIDKSKRSWLYVELEIEGELLEGWVARRHTAYFK